MPSDAPRVSVVVNNFNYGRYLRQAIQSALNQEFPAQDFEVIVVDDGSTDDSRQVIDSFGDRLRKVYQDNRGQAEALNAGFSAARGELVCLLDADDWWLPRKLSQVVARFEADPSLGLVQHWCEEVDVSGRPIPAVAPDMPSVARLDDFLGGRTFFTGTTGLSFRRRSLEKVLPIPAELFYCADEYLYSHLIFQAPAGTIPEVLAFRRVHGANRYAGLLGDPKRLEDHLKIREALSRLLEERLRRSGARLSPAAVAREEDERLRQQLLLARYRWRWREAFGRWRLARGPFRRVTLAAALVWPALYLRLQSAYARWRRFLRR